MVMEAPEPRDIVICADEIRALYPSPKRQFKVILMCVGICVPVFLAGRLLGVEWLGLAAIFLCSVLFIVPLVLKIRRFIAALPCGACGKAAGRHTTVSGVLHLKCGHCGSVTRTDCLMLGPGKPTKV